MSLSNTYIGSTESSISSVKNYLAELVREKLISIKREQYRSSVYYLLRPEELTKKQVTNFADKQSEADCHEAKSGYLNNLSKQRKEKYSPLSPHAHGETVNACGGGRVFFSSRF